MIISRQMLVFYTLSECLDFVLAFVVFFFAFALALPLGVGAPDLDANDAGLWLMLGTGCFVIVPIPGMT